MSDAAAATPTPPRRYREGTALRGSGHFVCAPRCGSRVAPVVGTRSAGKHLAPLGSDRVHTQSRPAHSASLPPPPFLCKVLASFGERQAHLGALRRRGRVRRYVLGCRGVTMAPPPALSPWHDRRRHPRRRRRRRRCGRRRRRYPSARSLKPRPPRPEPLPSTTCYLLTPSPQSRWRPRGAAERSSSGPR